VWKQESREIGTSDVPPICRMGNSVAHAEREETELRE